MPDLTRGTDRFPTAMSTTMEARASVKRLAVLGHCILNQNARAPGIAIHRGEIAPLRRILDETGYELLQLPCPEVSFTGTARWWYVYEQYDSAAYRRHCASLAEAMAGLVKPYAAKGYHIVLLGLGISPSCGIRMRQTGKDWRGKPFDVGDKATVEKGAGVWMQELEWALKRAGVRFRMLDVPPVLLYLPERVPRARDYPSTEESAVNELRRFLEARQ